MNPTVPSPEVSQKLERKKEKRRELIGSSFSSNLLPRPTLV
jgi:hypothetical protein